MDNKTSDDKPLQIKRVIEEIVSFENNELILENVNINNVNHSLKISNRNGRLVFDFNDKDYEIVIDSEGIRFQRIAYRHNHDHNDSESLQIGVDEKVMGVKKDELVWRARFPYKGEGYDYFKVPFGSVRVDY